VWSGTDQMSDKLISLFGHLIGVWSLPDQILNKLWSLSLSGWLGLFARTIVIPWVTVRFLVRFRNKNGGQDEQNVCPSISEAKGNATGLSPSPRKYSRQVSAVLCHGTNPSSPPIFPPPSWNKNSLSLRIFGLLCFTFCRHDATIRVSQRRHNRTL